MKPQSQQLKPVTTTALTTATRASALQVMAEKFSVDPAKLLSTLKATCFKGASDEEMLALVVVANQYGLNPFTKEIYAFPAKGGGITPIVSVDGWIRMANDHPQFDGIEFEEICDAAGKFEAVTCTIHRKDRNHPTIVTEWLSECRRNTEPWKMERRMLRHKALIQCSRVAFGFSGIFDEDEGRDQMRDVTPPKTNPFSAPAIASPVETVDEPAPQPADQDGDLWTTEDQQKG